MEKQWFTYGDSVNKNNKPEKCWCCRLGLLTMMTRRKITSKRKKNQPETANPNPLLSVFACGTVSLTRSHIIKCVHGNRTQTHTNITWFKRVDLSMLQERAFCFWNVECVCKRDDHNNKWNFIKLNWYFFSALHAACLRASGMRHEACDCVCVCASV